MGGIFGVFAEWVVVSCRGEPEVAAEIGSAGGSGAIMPWIPG